jgi:hypothetical protein
MSVEEIKDDKKIDYLEVDNNIPGQNYVCMSFISPEALMQEKAAFKCVKFLQSYCKDQKLKFDEVYGQYNDFTYKYEDKLQRDFDEQNNFQTSLRGIKVRGVFDTRQAADAHAKKLSTCDSSFHVFIGQVGYWLPWDPTADKIEDEHFQNSQLNDMMEKYQENNVNKDIFYEEQKRDKIKAAQEEVRKAEEEKKSKEKLPDVSEEYPIEDMEPEPESMEPEPEPEKECENCPEKECENCPEKECENCPGKECENCPKKECEIKKGSEVSGEIKASLEGDDPWTQKMKRDESEK